MEIDPTSRTNRVVNFVVTVGMLALLAGGLGVIVAMAIGAAGHAEPVIRKGLVRIAFLAFVLLAMVLVLLAWVVMRHVRGRLVQGDRDRAETPCVDAWAESGKRFKLEDKGDDAQDGEGHKDEHGKG